MNSKKIVVFGILGTEKDQGRKPDRWNRSRPTVDLCRHPDLPIERYELLYQKDYKSLADFISVDIKSVSETKVKLHEVDFDGDPYNFETVYNVFYDFAKNYPFNHEKERYLVNISTGTHVIQICLFLLTEAKYFPAKLVQSPGRVKKTGVLKPCVEVDLSLGKYDKIIQRFRREQEDDIAFLKDNIDTKNPVFENLITRILHTATNFNYPILLTGETGVGKTTLANRIHDLRKRKNKTQGAFIPVNCATLSGDTVQSMLFGHERGAFTGASQSRKGFLELADGGTLFLDEIGELDLEVQKMLLTAIEDRKFRKLGGSVLIESSFYLIAGTNCNLMERIKEKRFRKDLLSRIDTFTFEIPELRHRPEDIEPNLKRELERFSFENGIHITINKESLDKYLKFAQAPSAVWSSNFRDLNSSVIRMAINAKDGRITEDVVAEETKLLQSKWNDYTSEQFPLLQKIIGLEKLSKLDLFDCYQLEEVIKICNLSKSRSDAGRKLYNVSRLKKKRLNDAARLNNYLEIYELDWDLIKTSLSQ